MSRIYLNILDMKMIFGIKRCLNHNEVPLISFNRYYLSNMFIKGNQMKKVVALIVFITALEAEAQIQENYTFEQEAPVNAPVYVFGSANEGNGQRNSFLLEQNSEENPLGNPIQEDNSLTQSNPPENQKLPLEPAGKNFSLPQSVVQESLPQNPQISPQESPQIVNKQIQNTLYESGGRIYDIQSYPATDINVIEQPNLNKTITTYPAY